MVGRHGQGTIPVGKTHSRWREVQCSQSLSAPAEELWAAPPAGSGPSPVPPLPAPHTLPHLALSPALGGGLLSLPVLRGKNLSAKRPHLSLKVPRQMPG